MTGTLTTLVQWNSHVGYAVGHRGWSVEHKLLGHKPGSDHSPWVRVSKSSKDPRPPASPRKYHWWCVEVPHDQFGVLFYSHLLESGLLNYNQMYLHKKKKKSITRLCWLCREMWKTATGENLSTHTQAFYPNKNCSSENYRGKLQRRLVWCKCVKLNAEVAAPLMFKIWRVKHYLHRSKYCTRGTHNMQLFL